MKLFGRSGRAAKVVTYLMLSGAVVTSSFGQVSADVAEPVRVFNREGKELKYHTCNWIYGKVLCERHQNPDWASGETDWGFPDEEDGGWAFKKKYRDPNKRVSKKYRNRHDWIFE
ncbi:hypothetical protein [Pasteuria penetrans]|uniref:hypothetical protein n=1 Tax=Pasteuria penetrans TaxID=86005 RepID=UPI000FC22875|nr:hypothetical protein [Pasteuria penetrans]